MWLEKPKQNKAKVMRFSQLDCGKSRIIKKQPYLPRPTPWVCVHSSNNPRYWWFTTRLRRHYAIKIRTIRNTFFSQPGDKSESFRKMIFPTWSLCRRWDRGKRRWRGNSSARTILYRYIINGNVSLIGVPWNSFNFKLNRKIISCYFPL